jgi:hypothetical protein
VRAIGRRPVLHALSQYGNAVLDRIKIDAGKLIEKVGLGSTKQMRDDEVVPLICPTCQMLSRDRQNHPMPVTAWLLCMGLFSIFLVERAAGLRRPKNSLHGTLLQKPMKPI